MLTVIVDLHVRPEMVEDFVAGITANARASLRDEPGCLRFDVHRRADAPNRFLLHEVYADEDAFYRDHRRAPHYATWQQVAARCLVPGGQTNTFAVPVPTDVPNNQPNDEGSDVRS